MIIWRLFAVLLLLTVLRWVIVSVWRPAKKVRSTRTPGPIARRMVKDPYCGIYLASELALETRTRAGSLYFCSKECQENYAKAALKRQNS